MHLTDTGSNLAFKIYSTFTYSNTYSAINTINAFLIPVKSEECQNYYFCFMILLEISPLFVIKSVFKQNTFFCLSLFSWWNKSGLTGIAVNTKNYVKHS